MSPHRFAVVVAEGVGEDREQVVDAQLAWPHRHRVVEARVHHAAHGSGPSGRGSRWRSTSLSENPVLRVYCRDRHGVDLPFQQHVHRMAAELRRVEAVEEDRPPAALRVADFTSEDGRPGGLVRAC